MKKTVALIVHVLVILLTSFSFVVSTYIAAAHSAGKTFDMNSNWYDMPTPIKYHWVDSGISMFLFLVLFYVSYWFFLPKYLLKKEYKSFFLRLLLIPVIYFCCFHGLQYYYETIRGLEFRAFQIHNWSTFLFNGFIYIFFATIVRVFVQWFQDAQDKLELEKQNFKSEISLLKNQLNPHFLFNTLNNIDSLIIEQSPNASPALNKLSEIMRYMVYDSEKEWVPLSDELTYIESYVELQKMRMVNANIIQYEVSGEVQNKHIAPMLFISFVENAFKHTSLKDKNNNRIHIK